MRFYRLCKWIYVTASQAEDSVALILKSTCRQIPKETDDQKYKTQGSTQMIPSFDKLEAPILLVSGQL